MYREQPCPAEGFRFSVLSVALKCSSLKTTLQKDKFNESRWFLENKEQVSIVPLCGQ